MIHPEKSGEIHSKSLPETTLMYRVKWIDEIGTTVVYRPVSGTIQTSWNIPGFELGTLM